MSKGSKSRVTNKKRYDQNFDQIEWSIGIDLSTSKDYSCDWVPGIKMIADPFCPTDKAFIFSPRKPDETDAEWAKRCCVIKNIGKSV